MVGFSGGLSCRCEFGFQRLLFCEATYAENAETDHVAVRVHALHHRVVRSLFHIAGRFFELDLKLVGFKIEPEFYFVDHKSSPALGLFVRYAVTTKASASSYLTTTQNHLPPTTVSG